MAAVLRDTVFYAAIFTNKYVADARRLGGREVPLPFEITIASPSTLGDTYNCTVIPARARVIDLFVVTPTDAASVTLALGDAGSANRYMVATAFTTANTIGTLAATGSGFTPTVDTIVVATFAGAAPTVGITVSGCLYVIPGA